MTKNLRSYSETDIYPEIVEHIQSAGLDALKNARKKVIDLGEDGKIRDKINRFGEQDLRADYEAEETAIQSLRDAGLPARVVSEEHGQVDLVDKPTMLTALDGIDGTAAYEKGKRSGPMLAILSTIQGIVDNFTYDDCVFAGVADIKTGEITHATKGKGSYTINENGETDRAHVSNKTRLTTGVKVYIDGGGNGMAINDKVFGPLETVRFKTKPHNAGSSAVHYVDLARGRYDAVCEHTRKGNLELPTAYRLVTEAGGYMGAIIDGKLVDFGDKKFAEFGQDKNIPIIAAATFQLAKAISKIVI